MHRLQAFTTFTLRLRRLMDKRRLMGSLLHMARQHQPLINRSNLQPPTKKINKRKPVANHQRRLRPTTITILAIQTPAIPTLNRQNHSTSLAIEIKS